MKNKRLFTFLLVGLLTMVSACNNPMNSNANSNSSNNNLSNSTNNSNNIQGTSSNNNSSNTDIDKYFDAESAAILEQYIDFKIPFIDTSYEVLDYTELLGQTALIIYFNNITEQQFIEYLDVLDATFTFDEEFKDEEGEYWYYYVNDGFDIGIVYDNYSEEEPFIYIQISESAEKETVNGDFTEKDAAYLEEALGFKVPCVGEYYEMYDYSATYGITYFLIYFNYTTETDFDILLEKLDTGFTYVTSEEDEGLTYYTYSYGNLLIETAYDADGYDFPYILLAIYENNESEDSEFDGTHTENGYFVADDAAFLESIFDFEVPCVGEYYEMYDYSSGEVNILFYFNYVGENEYNSLTTDILDINFIYVEAVVDSESGLTFDRYANNYYIIDIAFDEEYDYPYIVMNIFAKSLLESSGSDDNTDKSYEGTPTVNGNFTADDLDYLSNYFDFEVPCVGSLYDIYDDSVECVDLYFYFYETTKADLEQLNKMLSNIFTFDENGSEDGMEYYLYSYENLYIDVYYDVSRQNIDCDYIYMNIYDMSLA